MPHCISAAPAAFDRIRERLNRPCCSSRSVHCLAISGTCNAFPSSTATCVPTATQIAAAFSQERREHERNVLRALAVRIVGQPHFVQSFSENSNLAVGRRAVGSIFGDVSLSPVAKKITFRSPRSNLISIRTTLSFNCVFCFSIC